MIAPDAQPPAELWWSNSAAKLNPGALSGLFWSTLDGVYVRPSVLPADAVRLVPASWSGLMSILDEHYPADVFVGGEGSDPGPRIVALSREVAQLRASAALAGTTTPTAELRTLRDLRSAVDAFIATKWPQKYSEYTVLRAAADSARVEIDLFASTHTSEGPS